MVDSVDEVQPSGMPSDSIEGGVAARMAPLRFATAQVFLATGAAAALERLDRGGIGPESARATPPPLVWAPVIIAPMAAAAAVLHARSATPRTAAALRFSNAAAIAVGGTLLLADLAGSGEVVIRRLGSLGLVAAGFMGYALDRHERASEQAERALRRRAAVVERLVPRRKTKLDRVVVHV